jgi:hypothetical protein
MSAHLGEKKKMTARDEMTQCGEGARRQPRVIAHAYTSVALVSVAVPPPSLVPHHMTRIGRLVTPENHRQRIEKGDEKGGGGCHDPL